MKNNYINATILVVDDNRENLNVVGNLLKDMGYKLAFAINGNDALSILEATKIDLILLDVMMPGMDGFQVCRLIKEKEETSQIPVIFLTAKDDIEDIVNGFTLGAVDYVTKPFRKGELLCRINTHLELKYAHDVIEKQTIDLQEANRFIISALNQFGKFLGNTR